MTVHSGASHVLSRCGPPVFHTQLSETPSSRAHSLTVPPLTSGHQVPISETVALKYFRDVVKGLEYLHFNRIVHGDLKVRTGGWSCLGSRGLPLTTILKAVWDQSGTSPCVLHCFPAFHADVPHIMLMIQVDGIKPRAPHMPLVNRVRES